MANLIQAVLFLTMMGLFIMGILFLLSSLFEDDPIPIKLSLCSFALAAIIFGVMGYATKQCDEAPWQREDPYVVHTVMALSDGNEVNGRLYRSGRYCMSGYINEKYTYVYGYKTAGGGMKIQKAGEDTTTVYLRDDMQPCAKWYKETKSFWWVKMERYTCDIYVPTDSLQAGITIDLQ